MATVFLYTDNPIAAVGLENVLSAEGQFQLISFSSDIPALLTRLETEQPTVLVLDLEPEAIFEGMSDVRRVSPRTAVVLWVDNISTELAFQAMNLGVRGVLRKSLPAGMQVKCLLNVAAGELWFEKTLTDRFLSTQRVSLSPREGQLIALLSQGMKNKEIADILRITEGTVKVYLSRLFDKLGAKDRFELALFGLKNLAHGEGHLPQTIGAASGRGLRSILLERPCAVRSL